MIDFLLQTRLITVITCQSVPGIDEWTSPTAEFVQGAHLYQENRPTETQDSSLVNQDTRSLSLVFLAAAVKMVF